MKNCCRTEGGYINLYCIKKNKIYYKIYVTYGFGESKTGDIKRVYFNYLKMINEKPF